MPLQNPIRVWTEVEVLLPEQVIVFAGRSLSEAFSRRIPSSWWAWFSCFGVHRRLLSPPSARAEVRRLIRKMGAENAAWGAPRIKGELVKIGFDVSERTVSRYLERIRHEPRRAGSQTWWKIL